MEVELVPCTRCGEFGDPDYMEQCFEDILCKKCIKEITKFDDDDDEQTLTSQGEK